VRAWSFQIGRGRGARAELDGSPRRLLRPSVERGEARAPGDVLDRDGEAVLVRCSEDAVWALEWRPAS
jgi:methionyl-tRNA formyltransferase